MPLLCLPPVPPYSQNTTRTRGKRNSQTQNEGGRRCKLGMGAGEWEGKGSYAEFK